MLFGVCLYLTNLFVISGVANISLFVESDSYNPLKVDVLLLTLLHLGAKSLSHSFAALSKYEFLCGLLLYQSALKNLAEGDERVQICVLKCVFEMWSTHQQMVTIIVDKLLKMHVIEYSAVVQWVFSEEMRQELLKKYVWDIVLSVAAKLHQQISEARRDCAKAEQKDNAQKSDHMDNDKSDHETTSTALNSCRAKLQGLEETQKNLFLALFQTAFESLVHPAYGEFTHILLLGSWSLRDKHFTRLRYQFFITHFVAEDP
ncbi:unnamed protein product [Soboliphyme baturini]|uniref:MIF4G_like_2 domain-containing protein n=1 Tax=Soboliphyme baturini TaxID=241478 RepID=A0A183IDA2_9BILA|nr:unnamed protein product [Soboliphyme baturini]